MNRFTRQDTQKITIVFTSKKKKILFSFDYDLTSFPWYGHAESSLPEFEQSVQKLKALSPRIVVSSHRGIIAENIDAEFDKFQRRIDERDEKILSLLGNEKTVDQLVECAPIYGRFPYAKSLLHYWEGQMIRKHLGRLELDGKVKRLGNFYIKTSGKQLEHGRACVISSRKNAEQTS